MAIAIAMDHANSEAGTGRFLEAREGVDECNGAGSNRMSRETILYISQRVAQRSMGVLGQGELM